MTTHAAPLVIIIISVWGLLAETVICVGVVKINTKLAVQIKAMAHELFIELYSETRRKKHKINKCDCVPHTRTALSISITLIHHLFMPTPHVLLFVGLRHGARHAMVVYDYIRVIPCSNSRAGAEVG